METQNIPTPNMASNMSSSVIGSAGERSEIFSNNFWGKEEAGYEALTSRLRQAKQTCEDVKNVFHERALIEEEYAKRLMRISKIPIGKDETGTLREALEVCKQELEATAKEHISLSQKIRTELEQEITNFMNKQKEIRKLQQAIVEKSLKNKNEQAALVQKAKEKYETECIKIQGLLAGRNSIMGKDLEKLNLRIEKTQMIAKAADQEYTQSVKVAQDTTQKWNYDWKIACDKYQDLEEERIDSLKTYLWTYANLISTVCVADDESCERIRVSLEDCSVEKDIQIFIRECATGPDIPEPPNYVNFYEGPKEDSVRYKRASFSRVPAYTDGGTTTSLDSLSLQEFQSEQNINSNGNGYHTRNDLGGYNSMNIERAQLYANTTSNITNNNHVNKNEEELIDEIREEEPVDPRAKQMLSIGDNVFEVETENKSTVEQDEIAKALENMQLVADKTNDSTFEHNYDSQNPTSLINLAVNSTASSNIDSLKPPNIDTPTGGNTSIINTNGGKSTRKPLPFNFVTDKPQPPIPDNIQQQQTSNMSYHQRNNSQSRLQFNSNNTSIITSNNISITPLQQQLQGGIVNGPGDLRRQSTESNNNGPISSQQQQISQNMSMRSSSSQSNRNSNPQQQGPGDIRRMSNTSSTHSSINNSNMTIQSHQGGNQGQMISQDQILNQGQTSNSQIISQGSSSVNSSSLSRSDTQRTTTSTNNSNNSLGIQLDAHGRVKQDDLATAFVTNGGRLPPESAKFQVNNIQGQQQVSLQGQISQQEQQMYRPQLQQMINQSSYRGPQQVIQQQQLHRSNTLNNSNYPTLASAFHHPQQGNPRTTLQGPIGVQQQPQLVGGQLAGQQLNFQDPNFYNAPINAPIIAQYQRPPTLNAQGFQQIQVSQQTRQLPQFGLQQPAQMTARSIPLQYHQPLLQRSVSLDSRPRTEDGKPIEFYVKALYDYQKTIPEEISFTAGDIIAVLNTHSDGWWEGEILDETRKNRGLFPSNYTEVLR